MRNFLDFCRSSFINNFIVTNNFSEPQNHRNLNRSRLIYLKKVSAHYFEDHIYTNKLEEPFFEKFFFQGLWAHFFPQKIAFILFFKGDYLISMYY